MGQAGPCEYVNDAGTEYMGYPDGSLPPPSQPSTAVLSRDRPAPPLVLRLVRSHRRSQSRCILIQLRLWGRAGPPAPSFAVNRSVHPYCPGLAKTVSRRGMRSRKWGGTSDRCRSSNRSTSLAVETSKRRNVEDRRLGAGRESPTSTPSNLNLSPRASDPTTTSEPRECYIVTSFCRCTVTRSAGPRQSSRKSPNLSLHAAAIYEARDLEGLWM